MIKHIILLTLLTGLCCGAVVPITTGVHIYHYADTSFLGLNVINVHYEMDEPQRYLTMALFGEQASLVVYGTQLKYTPTGGRYGQGYITGYDVETQTDYTVTLGIFDAMEHPELYPVQNYSGLELVNVPEPTTLCLVGVGGLFIKKRKVK